MTIPRFRVRTLMIVVALLAPLFAAGAFVLDLGLALEEFYGPGGSLERERNLSLTIAAGDRALAQGRWAEAEAAFRAASKLEAEHRSRRRADTVARWDAAIAIGLADALAGQGRSPRRTLCIGGRSRSSRKTRARKTPPWMVS